MLLIAAALGLLQAGAIDQSLFNESYGDYEGWEEVHCSGRIPGFGVSAYQAQSFLFGHVIFSFCARSRSSRRCGPGSPGGPGCVLLAW